MIQSEGQRLAAMKERQQEWWNNHTEAEKEKALGMSYEQAVGWWAVADLDSRDRVVAAYELAHPAEAEAKVEEKTEEPEAKEPEVNEETQETPAVEEDPHNEETPVDDAAEVKAEETTTEEPAEAEAPKKGRKSSKK